jgi:NADPH2:quinone reductase
MLSLFAPCLARENFMKAWTLPGYSGIESMTISAFPDPSPGAGEVVLETRFAALNPADRYLAIHQYPAKPAFPHVLGRDGVGTVIALGEGVRDIRLGETRAILRSEVGVNRPGTLAQRVAVEAAYTVPIPDGWSAEEAAAAPLVYVTAWQALTQWGALPEKAVVLISGASGGVGVACTQLGHALGFRIIGLSRSAAKSQRLRAMGAELTLNPQEPAWRDQLKAHLGKVRVDLAVDNIGGVLFTQILEVMGMFGRISCVGRLAGSVPDFNTASLFFRRLKVGGVAIATYTQSEAHGAWSNVIATLARNGARPLVDHVYAFEEVPAAFEHLEKGPMGKVLVKIDPR